MRRARRLPFVAAALAAATVGLAAERGGALGRLEVATVDVRQGLRGAEPVDDVAIVGIDEATFAELGRPWPFPRRLHARVVDRLREAGARTIVYDIQFTEPTRPADDLALFRAVRRAPGTVLATAESDRRGRTNVLGGEANLAAAGARAAASNLIHDDGAPVTHYPAAVGRLASLPIAAVESATGARATVDGMRDGRAWIDYRGPAGTIPAHSFAAVLRGRVDPAALAGRIVVVGPTAATFQDRHVTPAGDLAGAELQANAIWTALHGNPRRDAPGWTALVATVAAGLLAPLLAALLPLALAAALALAVAAAYAGAAQWAFAAGTVLPVAGPLVAAAAGLIAAVAARYAVAMRDGRRVARRNAELDAAVLRRTRELHETQLEVVQRLGRAAEMRDDETGAHIDRIGALARALGEAIGLPADEVELLEHASALHDVGKVGLPDRILLKPGPLDDDERAQMQRHAEIGGEILAGSASPLVRMAETIARTHHERWDGSGYPAGLRGEEIPLAGRICAICDVFDALISERRYKPAWPVERALDTIEAERGRHFDPAVVDAFLPVARALYADEAGPAADAAGEPARGAVAGAAAIRCRSA